MFDWQKQTQLFDYVEQLISAEAVKYDPGSPIRDGLDRLKAAVQSQRELVDKMKTVTPESAQPLFAEMAAAHAKYLRVLAACTELMQQAGMDYNRDLLAKLQQFGFPTPG
ncbi:MAG TPA: hypothetical protein VHX17_09580 [Candidatus Cybelea sp.]|jgi:hypothetical protein|nr:hypothetical protein [Candidatus Cybelea sp.]